MARFAIYIKKAAVNPSSHLPAGGSWVTRTSGCIIPPYYIPRSMGWFDAKRGSRSPTASGIGSSTHSHIIPTYPMKDHSRKTIPVKPGSYWVKPVASKNFPKAGFRFKW